MTHPDLIARLGTALTEALPGDTAHALMSPRPRGGWPAGFTPDHIRHAAGLLLLFPVHDRTHLILTVRSPHVRHAGQVSLPGGVIEPGETCEEAALREAQEEIAVAADGLRILGSLTPLDIPVSGFRLHPVVAALDRVPALRPSDFEVARILEIALDDLFHPAAVAWSTMMRGALTMDVPAFVVHGVTIWGATAMVLAEFLTIVGWPGPQSRRS